MDAARADAGTPSTSTPVLPDDFEVDQYLQNADAESNIVRLVARVLGEQRDTLLIDTAEGIYALPPGSVRRLQYLDDNSLFIIDIDPAATCVLHTTVRRLIRTRTGTLPSGSPDELLPAPRWSEPHSNAANFASAELVDRRG